MSKLVLGLAAMLPFAAAAQDVTGSEPFVHHGQGWSLFSGETLGASNNAFEAQVGYPGFSVGFLHGMSDRFDLGGAATANYGFEGSVVNLVPGFKVQALIRIDIYDSSKVNLGLKFAPGPLFYFLNQVQFGQFFYATSSTLVGFTLPMEWDLGIPVASAIMLTLSVQFPMVVLFGTQGGVILPILAGGGAEYYISKQFAVSFMTRMGPSIWAGNFSYFTFEALFGAAYKI